MQEEWKMRRFFLIVLVSLLVVTGCAVNPVTGKNELSLVPESWELGVGKKQYAPMRQAQGGDYVVDPSVQAYVAEVGQRLAAVSDRKLPYEFKVLNDSTPNAWALPGGKIVVNRGLLTELKSESELAAVLGHEIVHAAARHGAKGMQRGMLLQGALLATTIALHGKEYANLAQLAGGIGAKLISQKFSREAESEADHYGMVYMSRAGYDPQGAVELQRTFVKLFEKRKPSWLSGLFASHPPSRERLEANIREAAELPKGGEVGQARYLKRMAHVLKTKDAYVAYDKAKAALKKGDMAAARGLLDKAIAIEPREAHFYALKGDIERKRGHRRLAKRYYDKAVKLNSGFFYYYLQRGMLEGRMGARAAARADLLQSAKLLPTADAYNALGNIARIEGDVSTAKRFYAQAAESKSQAGKSAYASLVKLDLPENPGKYIKVRTGISQQGQLIAELSNPTPYGVGDIVIAVRYPTSAGQLRDATKAVYGYLPSGRQMRVPLGSGFPPEAGGRVQGMVIRARILK